jgi:hypothetical protein
MGLWSHKQYEDAASHSEINHPEYLWWGQTYIKYINPHRARRQNLK